MSDISIPSDNAKSSNNSAKIENICVYCGSSSKSRPAFQESAVRTGEIIAENNWTLVYGGANVGLMGMAANAALKGGAKVTGIIPHDLIKWEIAHQDLTSLIEVNSMHERKMEMVRQSDAFVILPGGLGTLDETFEILTWKQIGLHDKPVVLANIDGYWDKFLDLVTHLVEEKFALDNTFDMIQVVESIDDIPHALKTAPKSKSSPITKWM